MQQRWGPQLAAPFCLLLLAIASRSNASCGSAVCPLDTHALDVPGLGQWYVDLSFQRIDQDEPRIGTRDATVGEIPTEHAEVRTLNRTAALAVRWAPTASLLLGAVVPYVDRFHEHIETGDEGEESLAKHDGPHGERETWDLTGAGDPLLDVQWKLATAGRETIWLTGGVELPTGPDDQANDDGEIAEPALQPGSGSTDVVLGAVVRGFVPGHALFAGPEGDAANVPWFVSGTFRRNGRGREDYRLGDEWQLNVGTAYPLSARADAVLQVNARHRAPDDPGRTDEDPDHTGGDFVFLSPGLRVVVHEPWAAYAFLQLPVYQDVRGLQLVAQHNALVGLQVRW